MVLVLSLVRRCRTLGPCVRNGMLKRWKGSCRTGRGFTARYQWWASLLTLIPPTIAPNHHHPCLIDPILPRTSQCTSPSIVSVRGGKGGDFSEPEVGTLVFTDMSFQDHDRRIREATQQAFEQLVLKVRRSLAPILKSLMGHWILSQCDTYTPAASAACQAFQAAFSPGKQPEAIGFCKDDILNVSSSSGPRGRGDFLLFVSTQIDLIF